MENAKSMAPRRLASLAILLAAFFAGSSIAAADAGQSSFFNLIDNQRSVVTDCSGQPFPAASKLAVSPALCQAAEEIAKGKYFPSFMTEQGFKPGQAFSATVAGRSPQQAFGQLKNQYCASIMGQGYKYVGIYNDGQRWVVLLTTKDIRAASPARPEVDTPAVPAVPEGTYVAQAPAPAADNAPGQGSGNAPAQTPAQAPAQAPAQVSGSESGRKPGETPAATRPDEGQKPASVAAAPTTAAAGTNAHASDNAGKSAPVGQQAAAGTGSEPLKQAPDAGKVAPQQQAAPSSAPSSAPSGRDSVATAPSTVASSEKPRQSPATVAPPTANITQIQKSGPQAAPVKMAEREPVAPQTAPVATAAPEAREAIEKTAATPPPDRNYVASGARPLQVVNTTRQTELFDPIPLLARKGSDLRNAYGDSGGAPSSYMASANRARVATPGVTPLYEDAQSGQAVNEPAGVATPLQRAAVPAPAPAGYEPAWSEDGARGGVRLADSSGQLQAAPPVSASSKLTPLATPEVRPGTFAGTPSTPYVSETGRSRSEALGKLGPGYSSSELDPAPAVPTYSMQMSADDVSQMESLFVQINQVRNQGYMCGNKRMSPAPMLRRNSELSHRASSQAETLSPGSGGFSTRNTPNASVAIGEMLRDEAKCSSLMNPRHTDIGIGFNRERGVFVLSFGSAGN